MGVQQYFRRRVEFKLPDFNLLGDFGTLQYKFIDAVYVSSNNSIYFIPGRAEKIVKLSLNDNSINFIGDQFSTSIIKWGCAKLAPNGKIYCLPFSTESRILVIDTNDDSISFFGNLGTGNLKYQACVLAQTGNIYGIPRSATQIIKIDTTTNTISNIGASNGYSGAVLSANGYIYGTPFTSSFILKLDPSDDTFTTFGNLGTGNKFFGATLGLDDKIYLSPLSRNSVGVIDTVTDTFSEFGNISGNNKFGSPQLMANGEIICPSLNFDGFLKITPSSQNTNIIFSGEYTLGIDNIWGSCIAPTGQSYFTPTLFRNIFRINNFPPLPSGISEIPNNLSDLPASYYNRFHNKN